jgi:hypothetical protein
MTFSLYVTTAELVTFLRACMNEKLLPTTGKLAYVLLHGPLRALTSYDVIECVNSSLDGVRSRRIRSWSELC